MDDPNLWALDLEQDQLGRLHPWRAHLIVRTEHDRFGETRTAACGEQFTAGTHPRGWWSTRSGNLPLSGPDDIHCGKDQVR
jgi:hypothetical protein